MDLPKRTKRGNSDSGHRIALMQEVLASLPCTDIRALTMDREFVGMRWLSWLSLMEIPFVVRVKANTMVGGNPAWWWCERKRRIIRLRCQPAVLLALSRHRSTFLMNLIRTGHGIPHMEKDRLPDTRARPAFAQGYTSVRMMAKVFMRGMRRNASAFGLMTFA